MKKLLAAMFVALLMVGCGDPVLNDKETLDGIIAEAIDDDRHVVNCPVGVPSVPFRGQTRK